MVALDDEQAALIRQLTVITSSIAMTLPLYGVDVPVHLVGRKINKMSGQERHQHGTIPLPLRATGAGLSFAEQVVSRLTP